MSTEWDSLILGDNELITLLVQRLRTLRKWPVLCRVGRWTLLTHSLMLVELIEYGRAARTAEERRQSAEGLHFFRFYSYLPLFWKLWRNRSREGGTEIGKIFPKVWEKLSNSSCRGIFLVLFDCCPCDYYTCCLVIVRFRLLRQVPGILFQLRSGKSSHCLRSAGNWRKHCLPSLFRQTDRDTI